MVEDRNHTSHKMTRVACCSHIGKRSNQEDKFAFGGKVLSTRCFLLLLCNETLRMLFPMTEWQISFGGKKLIQEAIAARDTDNATSILLQNEG